MQLSCLWTNFLTTSIPAFSSLSARMYSWVKRRSRGHFPKSCQGHKDTKQAESWHQSVKKSKKQKELLMSALFFFNSLIITCGCCAKSKTDLFNIYSSETNAKTIYCLVWPHLRQSFLRVLYCEFSASKTFQTSWNRGQLEIGKDVQWTKKNLLTMLCLRILWTTGVNTSITTIDRGLSRQCCDTKKWPSTWPSF